MSQGANFNRGENVVLQIAFVVAFGIMMIIAWQLWLLDRQHDVPGVKWWVYGCVGLGLTPLLSAVSLYVGEWARAVAAHLTMVGGMGAVWIGTRIFLGERLQRGYYWAFAVFLACAGFAFFWFWLMDPMYQARLTINSILLLVFSVALSQTLFSARIGQGAVTSAGILYTIFAFLNGFRCINMILFPDPGSYFLSSFMAKALTMLMIPVMIAALVTHIFMIRAEVGQSFQKK